MLRGMDGPLKLRPDGKSQQEAVIKAGRQHVGAFIGLPHIRGSGARKARQRRSHGARYV